MYNCPKCLGNSLIKRGSYYNKTEEAQKQRYCCSDCKFQFSVELPKVNENSSLDNKRYVITSRQEGVGINEQFYETLINYCAVNSAELIILGSDVDEGVDNNFNIGKYVKVYGNLNLSKTMENPLAGLDGLSKGYSLIVGHPVLQFKTLPVFGDNHPIIMSTTGTISLPVYDTTKKAGAKAEHNHSYSAIVLEIDTESDIFHIRVLNCDDNNSFYDLDGYYDGTHVSFSNRVDALVLGDEHWAEHDKDVYKATHSNADSMVNVLRPKTLVRHDSLSYLQASSHHTKNNFLARYRLHKNNNDDVLQELLDTTEFIRKTTTKDIINNVLVDSNHHSHLTQWLSSGSVQYDYKNAEIYYFLMYHTLKNINDGGKGDVSPFEFFFRNFVNDEEVNNKTIFLGNDDSYIINGIELGLHGHVGINGAKGSPTSFSRLATKVIIGHSHSPSILKGAYTVGTSSEMKLSYSSGPSTWLQTHCIIHKNGRRQLISIIKGKWKL